VSRRGAALAAMVAAGLVALARCPRGATVVAGSGGLARAVPRVPHPAEAPARTAPAIAPPGGVRDPDWGNDAPITDDTLEAYRLTSVYPPESRPLGRFNDDLLHPDRRHEDFRPSSDEHVEYRFTADRYFVHGDEPLVATLEVRRDGLPVEVTVTTAFAAPYRPATIAPEPARTPLAFARQGTMHVGESRPAAGLREAALVGIYIEFEHGGDAPERAMFVVHATPAAAIPARFTGQFRDRIENGSLVVEVGVEVWQPGWYLIDANLHDADDFPVAWTRFKGELAAGTQWVPLLFFGKVLVDSKSTTPWHLGELRGARYVERRDPDLDSIPLYEGTYHTARYRLSDFSDAPYDSAEKQERLELLEAAQRQGRR